MEKEYRLLKVESKNTYSTGDSVEYVATYEWRKYRKKYFLFGEIITKTWLDEATFNVPDDKVVYWLYDMERKKNIWRKMK